MEVNHPDVERLALKYNCDPTDPIFGIFEAVIGMRDAFHNHQVPLLPEAKRQIETVVTHLDHQLKSLNEEANRIEGSRTQIESQMQGIEKYWLQAHWHYGFFGSFITALVLCGVGGFFYYGSADKALRESHVELYHSKTDRGTRFILSGNRLLSGTKSTSRIEAEFER